MSTDATATLAEALEPLMADPQRAAILCDVDGTLAPIVRRPEDAHVREDVSRLLGRIGRRYGIVACVSGRPVAEARRLVGVGAITYVGSHGAEVLAAGDKRPRLLDAFASWEGRVRAFVRDRADEPTMRAARVRLEDKGPIKAFHWRGSPDEEAAETLLQGVAQEAQANGLDVHWGRKVLEIRPPVPIDKGQAVRTLLEGSEVRSALYGGDDATDLDAFDALDALVTSDDLDRGVRVGVRSTEGPAAIVQRADVVVDGVDGFVAVLEALADDR